MNKRYITEEHMEKGILEIVSRMYADNWRPEYIVGITRGGLIPAVKMSHYTGIKMHTLDVRLRDGDIQESNEWFQKQVKAGTKILVLDDINDTGETFKWICKDWDIPTDNARWRNRSVRFAAIIDNIPSKFDVDYTSFEIDKSENPEWIVFPFEEWW